RLDDASLLRRNLLDLLAEDRRVIQTQGRDDRHDRGDDVGAVEASPQSRLPADHLAQRPWRGRGQLAIVPATLDQGQQRQELEGGGETLRSARGHIDGEGQLSLLGRQAVDELLQGGLELLERPWDPVEAIALAEVLQVRAGVEGRGK